MAAAEDRAFCPLSEKEIIALEQLFDRTSGKHWKNRGGWKTSYRNLSWYGVSLTKAVVNSPFQHVSVLALLRNNLVGQIPESLCDLEHLNSVDLSGNKITGLPERISDLAKLQR